MGLFAIIIFGCLFLILVLYLFFQYRFRYWRNRGFPQGDPKFIWGDLAGAIITRNIGETLKGLYDKFENEKFVGIYFFFKPVILLRDPDLIKTVLVKDFMYFHDRGIVINEKLDPLAANLFTITGLQWKNLRIKLTPTFTSGKIKIMLPIMVECSKKFSDVLEEAAKKGEVIEVKEYAARFTTDIIASVAFGLDANSLSNPHSEFRKKGQELVKPSINKMLATIFSAFFPRVANFFKIKQIPTDIEEFFLGVLKETTAYRRVNNEKRGDFWDLMIQLIDDVGIEKAGNENESLEEEDDSKFTFLNGAAQALVFFSAGFETSSFTMQFALYELAKNPVIQQRTRDEIFKTLKKHKNQISYECVKEMVFLKHVIDETLRLYSVLPAIQRICNEDYKIPGTNLIIPKGTGVLIPSWAIQRDEKYFFEPMKFNPDNFTEEEKSNRHQYSYLPFGEGPRNCIGMRFAILQMQVGLITLLRNYEFSVAKSTPIPIKFIPYSSTFDPIGGMHLKITKYEKESEDTTII